MEQSKCLFFIIAYMMVKQINVFDLLLIQFCRQNYQQRYVCETAWFSFLKNSRLGLEPDEKEVKISRLGLISVSENNIIEVSVSSRSRKIILKKSRYRLGLEISIKPGLGLVLGLEILIQSSLGLVSVSQNVVSSNSVTMSAVLRSA